MRLTSGAARSVHPRPARRASLLALVALLLSTVVSLPSRALAQGAPFDPPDISCSGTSYSDAIVLNICGGGWGGAPAGFVVDFESQADFAASGWNSAASSYVSVQFTGDAYSLDAHECVNVQFGKNTFTGAGQTATNNSGAALACNTGYVFRAKALATSNMAESGWSGTLRCSTDYDCNIPAPGVGGATGGTPFDPPDIGCSTTTFSDAIVLNLCGGGWGGAPAGFIVEMQTQADLQTHGWSPTSPSYLGVTFTGDAYSLGAHQCVEIQFGKNTFTGPGEQATSNAGAPPQPPPHRLSTIASEYPVTPHEMSGGSNGLPFPVVPPPTPGAGMLQSYSVEQWSVPLQLLSAMLEVASAFVRKT